MDSFFKLTWAVFPPDIMDFRLMWPTETAIITGGHCNTEGLKINEGTYSQISDLKPLIVGHESTNSNS